MTDEERGFELGRHVLQDGRSFEVKRNAMKYAEVYELHYQGQITLFRPVDFDKAREVYDLQAPLRLGGDDELDQESGQADGDSEE